LLDKIKKITININFHQFEYRIYGRRQLLHALYFLIFS